MPPQDRAGAERGHVPEDHRRVHAPRGEDPPARVEGQAEDRVAMADLLGLVLRRRQEPGHDLPRGDPSPRLLFNSGDAEDRHVAAAALDPVAADGQERLPLGVRPGQWPWRRSCPPGPRQIGGRIERDSRRTVPEIPDLDDLILAPAQESGVVLPDEASDPGMMSPGLDGEDRLLEVPHLVLAPRRTGVRRSQSQHEERDDQGRGPGSWSAVPETTEAAGNGPGRSSLHRTCSPASGPISSRGVSFSMIQEHSCCKMTMTFKSFSHHCFGLGPGSTLGSCRHRTDRSPGPHSILRTSRWSRCLSRRAGGPGRRSAGGWIGRSTRGPRGQPPVRGSADHPTRGSISLPRPKRPTR